MYQSIFYNRTPGEDQWQYFLRDDKKGIHKYQYWPTVYKLDEDGEFETLFGDRCSAIQGKYDRKDPTILEKGIMKMRMAHEIKIDHDKTFEFKSGGSHLMLMDFKGPLKAGEKVKITLHFKDKKNQSFNKSIYAIIK